MGNEFQLKCVETVMDGKDVFFTKDYVYAVKDLGGGEWETIDDMNKKHLIIIAGTADKVWFGNHFERVG